MSEYEHPNLLLGGIPTRSLDLLIDDILVDHVTYVLSEHLLLFAPKPIHLCLVLGWGGE